MVNKRHEFNWPAGISCLNTETQTSEIAIICHPDGTVTACTLQFKDAHGQQTMLQIDRLTGSACIVNKVTRSASTQNESSPAETVTSC
jgi:hypothetical protein